MIKWKRDSGEETESCIGIYYIILVGNIYYFNKYNRKVKVGILGVL